MTRFAANVLALLGSLLLGCQPQIPVVPGERAPIPNLSDQACPNLSGTYNLLGQPLPGMPEYYRKVTIKLTLDRMLGVGNLSEDVVRPAEIKLVQSDTLELNGETPGAGYAGRVELLPGDTVSCFSNEMTIQQLRATRGSSAEQQWRTTTTARYLTLDSDGALVVKTRIRAQSKSAYMAYEEPLEVYAARFRRIN